MAEATAEAAAAATTSQAARRRCRYHVILTGASGYLGQHLLHDFMQSLDDSYHIHALFGGNTPGFVEAVQQHHHHRHGSQQRKQQQQRLHQTTNTVDSRPKCIVQVEALDLTDVNAVEEWMKAKDDAHFFSSRDCNTTTTTTTTTTTNTLVCIHTAALSNPRQCQQDAARAHTLNVPTAFFDACQSRGCAMICLSTDQVYCGSCPPYTDEEQQAERSTASLRPVNVYGATKLAMEQSVLQCPSKDAPSVILRSSIILGRKAPILPEHAHDTFLHFCASRQGVETEFYTDERRTVVSVDDVIASIHWFVRDSCRRLPVVHVSTKDDIGTMPPPVTGIFNMGGPTSVSRFDMARAVFEHLGYDPVHLVAKEKKQSATTTCAGQQHVPSPLDISMDSTKIKNVTGRTFESLSIIVQKTFSQHNNAT